jgi:hypothetical protein
MLMELASGQQILNRRLRFLQLRLEAIQLLSAPLLRENRRD